VHIYMYIIIVEYDGYNAYYNSIIPLYTYVYLYKDIRQSVSFHVPKLLSQFDRTISS